MRRICLFFFLAVSCMVQACGEVDGGVDPNDLNGVDAADDAARRCSRYRCAVTCGSGCSCPAIDTWASKALAASQSGTFEVAFDATPGIAGTDDLVVGLSNGPASTSMLAHTSPTTT